MATKTILKDASKSPFLFLRSPLFAAASTAAPKSHLVQTTQPPLPSPLLHLSGLRSCPCQGFCLCQKPAFKADRVGLGGPVDSSFGPQPVVQARRGDSDDEVVDIGGDWKEEGEDDEDFYDEEIADMYDEDDMDSEEDFEDVKSDRKLKNSQF